MLAWLKEFAPLLTALGGLSVLASVFLVPSQIRKIRGEGKLSEADAASKLSAASIALLEPAQTELKRLSDKLKETNQQANNLRDRLQAAEAELGELRTQVSTMSKELDVALAENRRLRGEDVV